MRVSQPRPPGTPPTRPPGPPPRPPQQDGRDRVDLIKQRSAFVSMLEPASMAVGVAVHFRENLQGLKTVVVDLQHGQSGAAADTMAGLVEKAVHPQGKSRGVYTAGQIVGGAVDGCTGAFEIYQAVQNGDRALGYMGAADVVAGVSNLVMAAGHPLVSLGLCVAASASKVGLVAAMPDQFSRIQKAKTLFDAGDAVSFSLIRAGLGVVPILIANSVLGPCEVLYLNNQAVRQRIDAGMDWVTGHFTRS